MNHPKDELHTDAHGVTRCWWCVGDSLYEAYHDTEWGFPAVDDNRLFENICLDGFQAGLSWLTILRKRESFRAAFAGFDIERVARFNKRTVDRLLRDAGIIRHRGKIEAAINNARHAIELIEEFGSLAAYVWRYEPSPRARTKAVTRATMPATSPESVALSKDLKRRGWSFVGPTTLYAFMQAMGLVDDHLSGCDVRPRVESARQAFVRPASR
ncbi:MAG: DNA-3-methyladenine glycosylase I [Planctomycetes bacterium]|nr:DNA-3-methyladenine glycosylase I [Planctomycetota bacterium]